MAAAEAEAGWVHSRGREEHVGAPLTNLTTQATAGHMLSVENSKTRNNNMCAATPPIPQVEFDCQLLPRPDVLAAALEEAGFGGTLQGVEELQSPGAHRARCGSLTRPPCTLCLPRPLPGCGIVGTVQLAAAQWCRYASAVKHILWSGMAQPTNQPTNPSKVI